jgi:hypothetical protein
LGHALAIPAGSWYYGSEFLPPASPIDTLKTIVLPRYRPIPNFQWVEQEPAEEWAQENVRQLQAQGDTSLGEGFRVRFRYQMEGTPMMELIQGMVLYNKYMGGGFAGPIEVFTATTTLLACYRAKESEFTRWHPVFEKMLQSIRVNPQWHAYQNQMIVRLSQQQQMQNQQQLKAALERGRQISQEHDRIWQQGQQRLQQIDQFYDNIHAQDAREDYLQGERVRTIRGTDLYNDPTRGGEVELPDTYHQVWSNGFGEYILSDDLGYNPNAANPGSWNQIEPS